MTEFGRVITQNEHNLHNGNFQFDELKWMEIDGVTSCMKIREVNENKKQFISLLLLADEQESMVDCYLEKGTMYVIEDNDVKAECVVTDEGNGILEIKNIAVDVVMLLCMYQLK